MVNVLNAFVQRLMLKIIRCYTYHCCIRFITPEFISPTTAPINKCCYNFLSDTHKITVNAHALRDDRSHVEYKSTSFHLTINIKNELKCLVSIAFI